MLPSCARARCRLRENFQGDAVIREREDRRMNWAGDYRSCLQRRENPHAVPAATRLLEQNSIATKSEGARFDKFFWRPRDFFDRESLRIVRAAEFFHGTNYAH